MTTKFSIVMLTYKNYETFHRCITSMTPYFIDERILEIIILDNGSDGNMITYLEKIEKNITKINVIFSSVNLGVAGGRKILFSRAKGDIIISVDSDIVVLDHNYLLTTLENNLTPPSWEQKVDNEKFYLLGGGGGNHTHYPSLFTGDVVHSVPREKKNEFILVSEVAGWCQCFRKSLLDKVKIDQNFSPFWGEDTDFCIQINKIGGRMAIFGRGVVQHSFSTCRDVTKKLKQDIQWEKVLDKWHSIPSHMDIDWYKKNYKTETPVQDYLSNIGNGIGILDGRLNPGIQKIIQEKQNLDCKDIWELENLTTLDLLIGIHFKYLSCSLVQGDTVSIVNPEKLEKLDAYPDNIILFLTPDQVKTVKVPKAQKVRKISICIDLNHDPYLLLAVAVKMLSLDFEKIELIGYDLEDFDLSLNRKGIRNFVRNGSDQVKRINSFDFNRMREVVKNISVKKVFRSSLLITQEYQNIWCPEYSPVHIFPELLIRIYNQTDLDLNPKKLFLTFVINDGDLDEEGSETVCSISRYSDIMYISTSGHVDKIPPGVDYYHQLEQYSLLKFFMYLNGGQMYGVYDYDYIVLFDNRTYQITGDVKEFYQLSRYQNQVMVKQESSFFSISVQDLDKIENLVNMVVKLKEEKKISDPEKIFNLNFPNLFYFPYTWNKKTETVDQDEIISYHRDDEKGKPETEIIDFPLTLR